MRKDLPAGLILLLLWLPATGCSNSNNGGDESDGPATGVVNVYVVNYPLKYFAQRIGGQHVRVTFPVPKDQDPAYWRPDTEAIEEFQKAELILLNGASYAKWVKTASLPASKLVDTSASFRDRYIQVEDAVTHAHGPGGEHSHAGTAFTTWLDPQLAVTQAAAVRDALIKRRPQHADQFNENFEGLAADLNQLDAEIEKLVGGKSGRPILFSHPVYQYFSRRYQLNAQSVHWEPDQVPDSEQLEELASILERHPAKWMIWEAAPVDENVRQLSQLGIQGAVFNPCGNAPESGDFLETMRRNVDTLRPVFE